MINILDVISYSEDALFAAFVNNNYTLDQVDAFGRKVANLLQEKELELHRLENIAEYEEDTNAWSYDAQTQQAIYVLEDEVECLRNLQEYAEICYSRLDDYMFNLQ